MVTLGGLLVTVHWMSGKLLTTEENRLLCKDFLGNATSFLECHVVSAK